MDRIPNAPSWDFTFGFIIGVFLFLIIWIVIEWIAKGKRDE